MDGWKFNETKLYENKEFYSNINVKDITNVDYMHLKRVLNLESDLYFKGDTLV